MASSLKNKRVLVIGATGFLGGHIAEAVLRRGAKLYFTYRTLNKDCYFFNERLHLKGKGVKGDLADLKGLKAIIKKYRISHIFHFGGLLPSVHKKALAYDFFANNLVASLNVLEAARQSPGLEAVLIPSSTRVFDPKSSTHPYDASKIACELLASSFFKAHNLPIAVGRFGNVFGPGDTSLNRIVPAAMEALVKNRSLELKSTGTAKKNFIYVKDVAEGFMLLAENMAKAKGKFINFVGNNNWSVVELLAQISKVLGRKLSYKVNNTIADNQRLPKLEKRQAKKILGWTTTYNFERAIKETYDWYEKYLT